MKERKEGDRRWIHWDMSLKMRGRGTHSEMHDALGTILKLIDEHLPTVEVERSDIDKRRVWDEKEKILRSVRD